MAAHARVRVHRLCGASRGTIGLFHGAIPCIRKGSRGVSPILRNSFRTGSLGPAVDATTRRISFGASATFVFTTSPIALTRNGRGMRGRCGLPERVGFAPRHSRNDRTDAPHLRETARARIVSPLSLSPPNRRSCTLLSVPGLIQPPKGRNASD